MIAALNVEVLFTAANKAVEVGARLIIVDLGGVDRITSAGMRTLTKIYKLLTPDSDPDKSVRMRLCSGPQQVVDVLEMTGFLRRMPHHESVAAATAAFG
jgi:anti-anti-sigma factor